MIIFLEYPRPKLEEMTQELGSVSDLEALAGSLGVSIEDPSSCSDVCQNWLEDNLTYTWSEVLVALNKMEERELALEIEKKYKLSSFDLQAANTSTGMSSHFHNLQLQLCINMIFYRVFKMCIYMYNFVIHRFHYYYYLFIDSFL